MELEKRTDSHQEVDNIRPATVFQESQIVSPSPSINIHSISSEVQTCDGVKFDDGIFIMSQQSSGKPVLYEATQEFKNYLRSQSVNEEPKPATHLIVSGNDTPEPRKSKRTQIIRILIGTVLLAIVCGGLAGFSSLFKGKDDSIDSWFVDRNSWHPRPRTCSIPELKPRVKLVIMAQGGVYCNRHDDCIDAVRNQQAVGISAGSCDIADAFLIGGDERIYEGRGFRQRTNNTDKYFDKAILVGFLGNYDRDVPSTGQFGHLRAFLDRSLRKEELSGDYKITGAIYPVGERVKSEMSTWERWTDSPNDITFPT